uniref:Uncharacterized protein U15 n=1 Tax=Hyposoter didymator TaxID=260305 RepID=D7P5P3_HYPDD|nr:unknown [Hyposoter didymator]
METIMFLASGSVALTQIIRKCLEVPGPRKIPKPTDVTPLSLSDENSESIFHARTYFNKQRETPIQPVIAIEELDTPCVTTHDCTVRFGDGFACLNLDTPVRMHITVEDVAKSVIFGGNNEKPRADDADVARSLVFGGDVKPSVKNEVKNCKRCVPVGKSRRVIKCNPLTSIAVCSSVFSPQTNRFDAHWVCESLYPEMFTEDPETGDITKCRACGADENRGRLIHEVSRLPWDKHYERHGLYDPLDSLKCECYPFPFSPEEAETKRSLYAGNILLLPPTSTCRRSNCAPGRPHMSDPQACDCPAGYVSCPILFHKNNKALHERLCWGSYVRNTRDHPMPSCVRDPCMPHAKMDPSTGTCVANDGDVTVVNDKNIFPNAPWGVPIKRKQTIICGTDMEAPLKKKKYIELKY